MLLSRLCALGAAVVLATVLLLAVQPLSSCLLDWEVPTEVPGDAAVTTTNTGSGQGGQTIFKPVFDSGRDGGGGQGGCGHAFCQDCVSCVLDELSSIASSADCVTYSSCVQQCLGNNSCIASCKLDYPAGAVLRSALDKQCGDMCGGLVPCQ